MPRPAPDLRRTWLFGPGADAAAHEAMARSGADVLIMDLEDFTPPARREQARRILPALLQRWRDATELDHARRRFVLECRAAGIEPVDAPYTFADVDGAVAETAYARRLGYHCKSLVRPEHAGAINAALTPSAEDLRRAAAQVRSFEAARERGEDRALDDGLWVEVPTYRNAQRLIERAARLREAS